MRQDTALCWLRRDLRLHDNAALYRAQSGHRRVQCLFVFDRQILEALPRHDRRVEFIHRALAALKQKLIGLGGDLLVVTGDPAECVPTVASQLDASAVYCAEDHEPQAIARDRAVAAALTGIGSRLEAVNDQVIFARDRLLTRGGTPFSVFTPYKNAWLAALSPEAWQPYDSAGLARERLLPCTPSPLPPLDALGFAATDLDGLGVEPDEAGATARLAAFTRQIDRYADCRDLPALDGTSRLSPHLRFGTLSVRSAVALAAQTAGPGAATWLNELIWREFYQQLLWHYPLAAGESFKPHYRNLAFDNRQDWFDAWRDGLTGYPLVDAAMRQLSQTGWMHNRLRMLVASFLVKDLLIDWRWGEAHFAELLLDFDLAANNGGWQWAASTGCDAQPYFRIFNPVTQSQRFDPDGTFIRRFVPELAGLDARAIHAPWLARTLPPGFTLERDYPVPIVDHAVQRQRALALFGRQ